MRTTRCAAKAPAPDRCRSYDRWWIVSGSELFVVVDGYIDGDPQEPWARRRGRAATPETALGTRTGQMDVQELAGTGQGAVGFVEHAANPWNTRGTPGVTLSATATSAGGGAGCEPGGVVDQDLV